MDFLKILQSLQTDKSFREQGGSLDAEGQLAKLLGFQEENQPPSTYDSGPGFGRGAQGNPPNVLSFMGAQDEEAPQMGEGNVDPRTIEVAASGPRMSREDPTTEQEPLQLGNVAQLLEAQAAAQNAPQRKSPMGVGGTLRKILGGLGDAFLVQGGAQPTYAPKVERERLADAMTGYTQNPQAAAERMAYGGFADESVKVWNDSQTQKVNQGTLDVRRGEMDRKETGDQAKRYEDFGKIFSQYAGSATPETYERVKPILNALKKRGGLGDEFVVPDTYEPALMRTYQYGGMPAQQQVRSVDKDEDQAFERVKEAGRNRRDNPPAARQPRSQTELEYFQEIGKKPAGQRTEAEQAFYKKYTEGTRGSKRSILGATPPPPASGKSRFRIIN